MRRLFTFTALCSLMMFMGCSDNDDWTPRQQIRRVERLVSQYPATERDFLQFIDDIEQGLWDLDDWITYRNGEVWNTSYDDFINTAFGKGSQFLDLIFYADGTCRQCYLYSPAPYNEDTPYPFLYTTLLWSYDSQALTIKLTNSEYQALGSPYAQTTLRLKYYRYGEFIIDGLQPSTEQLNGYTIRYVGQVDDPTARKIFADKYISDQEGESN